MGKAGMVRALLAAALVVGAAGAAMAEDLGGRGLGGGGFGEGVATPRRGFEGRARGPAGCRDDLGEPEAAGGPGSGVPGQGPELLPYGEGLGPYTGGITYAPAPTFDSHWHRTGPGYGQGYWLVPQG